MYRILCPAIRDARWTMFIRDLGYRPEQVQDFYPTPGTLSTCMFYTGIDPRTGKKVYVAKNPEDKAMQRALMQYNRPENRVLVIKALQKAGRLDLIGKGEKCLVPFMNSSEKQGGKQSGHASVSVKRQVRNKEYTTGKSKKHIGQSIKQKSTQKESNREHKNSCNRRK